MLKAFPLFLTVAASGFSACHSQPVACNQDVCTPCFCLGPEDVIVNAPVNPRTCDGDVVITLSPLCWKAFQDGMEYAIHTDVFSFIDDAERFINNIIGGEYLTPNFKAEPGVKIGVGYHSPVDGWDIGVMATFYTGRASSHEEISIGNSPFISSAGEGEALLPLWSAFQGLIGGALGIGLNAQTINTNWKGQIYFVDLELGRDNWVSKKVSIRPFIGMRIAQIDQNFHLLHQGGRWTAASVSQDGYNDEVSLKNDFKGVGLRSGLDGNWHFGCGWSVYSHLAASIVYGRFDVQHDEAVRQAVSPFSKTKVLETRDHFRSSRAMLDFALGLQYATLIGDSAYGLLARLSWEQNVFFDQNQLPRVNRIGGGGAVTPFPNNSGENVFHQRRGTLSTRGLTLTFAFEF